MPITDADFPIQFLVGRELALRQNVDSSTAARSALTGALISGGLMAPLLARHLAARQAPAPPPIIGTRPGGTGDSPWKELLTSVKVILDQTSAQVSAARKEAQKAQELADQMQKDRTDALKEICDTLTTAPATGKGAPSLGVEAKVD